MKKRLLASLLSLAMLLTMLPVTAFAAETADSGISITKNDTTTYYTTLEKAISQAANGDVIDVTKDITVTGPVSISSTKTIQINGVDSAENQDSTVSPVKITAAGNWNVTGVLGLGKNLTLNLGSNSTLNVMDNGYIVVGKVPGSNVTIEGDGTIEGGSYTSIRVVEGESPAEGEPVFTLNTTYNSPSNYSIGQRAGQVIIGENAKLDVQLVFIGDGYITAAGANASTWTATKDCTLDVYGTITNDSTEHTEENLWDEWSTISTNGNARDQKMKINIHNGATVKNQYACAMYLPANGECTIGDINEDGSTSGTGPVIEGGAAAIGLKSGSLTINGGTIKATKVAGTNEMGTWNNGINENGSAIIVESNPVYAGNASVTVKNAVITAASDEEGSANAFYFIYDSSKTATHAKPTLKIESGTFQSPGAYTFGMNDAKKEETSSVENFDFPSIEITDGTFTTYAPDESGAESNIDKVESYVENRDTRACRVNADGKTFSVVNITPLDGAAVTFNTDNLTMYSKLPEVTTETAHVTVSKTEWFKGESKIEGTYFNASDNNFKAKITVTPDHGYTFKDGAEFTVNGKSVTPESIDESAPEDRVLTSPTFNVNTEDARYIVNVTLKADTGVTTSPLESIDVAIYNRDENTDEPAEGESPVETGKTDNTGKVTFDPGFVEGKYIAVVAAKGGAYAHSTATFDLPPESGTETEVELTLQAPADRKTVLGSVSLNNNGVTTGVSDVDVTFTDEHGDKWPAKTGTGGTFTTQLPAGEYTATIEESETYEARSEKITITADNNPQSVFITLTAKAATTFTVSGTVDAGDTGLTDLSDLTVTLTGEGIEGSLNATTGENGAFTFETQVPNGTYTLTIAAGEGHNGATTSVTVNGANETATLTLTAKPAESDSEPETSDSESETSKPETSDDETSDDETSDDETSGDETSKTEIQSVEIDIDESDIEVGDPFPTPKLTTDPENAAKISTTWRNESEEVVTSAVSAGVYTATFVITPNEGYKFGEGTSYKINGDTKRPESLTVSLNVAEKPATQYSLNIPQSENGTVTPLVNGESATTAAADDTVTLDIAPNSGYKLLSVVVDGAVLDPEDPTFIMPAANVDIQVTFVEEQKVVAEVDPVDPDADTVEVSAAPAPGDIKDQIDSGTESFVEITTGAIQDGDGKEVEIPADKPVTVNVTVPQEDSEALKQSEKGLNVEIPNVITAEVPAEPLNDILADKPETEGVVFVCDRETVETDKAVFEIGFETTSGTKLPYTANRGLITLTVKVPFAPTTKIVITSEGKPVARDSEQKVSADGTVTFGTDHMSPFEFTKASAVVVPSDDYEISYPYRGSAKISINAVANEQYIIQVTVEGKAVPFVTTAPSTPNPTIDVNAPIGSKVEVWHVPAGNDPFTSLGAPNGTRYVTIEPVPAAD